MPRCSVPMHLLGAVFASLMVSGAKPLVAQIGTTTDVIVGRVVGPDSLGLRAAHVDVTSIESGITRKQMTGDDGRYSVIFPDGGGRYLLTVHYLGMAPARMLVQRRADEDRLVADFALTPTAIQLSAVTIEAQRIADSLGVGAGAIGQVLSKELLQQLGYEGNEAAALALVTPGVMLIQGGDTSMNAIAINGQSSAQTGHLIDGLAAGGASLPTQAMKSTSVITSAYDVANGQFTGGFVQQSTISGTNKFDGSLDSSVPLAPLGTPDASHGVLTRTQKGYRGGGNLAGPFVKDHLFGAFAFSMSSSSIPSASIYSLSPASLDRLGVIPDSVARFMNILDAHGLAKPVDNSAGLQQSGFRNGFGRIDFTPNEKNTFTLSGSEYRFWNRGFFTGPLATPTAGGEFSTESWRAQVALTSHLGAWVNDARASVSEGRFGATASLAAAGGSVIVPSSQPTPLGGSGISTLQLGGSPFAAKITTNRTVDAKDELSWLSSDAAHRPKLGLSITLTSSTGGAPDNVFGTYRFNSLTDFETGTPASYSRTLATTFQSAKATNAAMYLGDAWRTGPKLQLVYGVRLEHNEFSNPPQLNVAALTAFGIHTNAFPREISLSPRVGFTYGIGATDKKPAVVTIRGGAGIFRSGAGQVSSIFSTARDATGLLNGQANLSCVGAAVPPLHWGDFWATSSDVPTMCAAGTANQAVSALPRIVAVDPSFHLPRTLQASLSAGRSFAKIWNISLDGSMTDGAAGAAFRDLNLVESPRFTVSNEASRPVFAPANAIVPGTGAMALSSSRVNSAYGTVSLVSSYLRNEDRSISMSLGRMTPKFSINGSYTYSLARMQVVGVPSGGVFSLSTSVAGDPRDVQWIRTPWSSPHQVRLMLSYNASSWLSISPSVFAESSTGFDPMVSADINGDGAANDRAFIFDPAHTADTAVANGMTRLLTTAPASVRKCLLSQLGRIAGAGSCAGPWYSSGGLAVRMKPPWSGGRLSLSLQTNNVPAGLDLLLHGSNGLRGWGQYPATNETLLYVRGFDPVSQTFKYSVNERFGTSTTRQSLYRQPMQLTLVARLALGKMGGGPGAGPAGPGGFVALGASGVTGTRATGAAGAAQSSHADSLRTRIAATLPNVFRRTLALKDSLGLALDSAQAARLKFLGDAYQANADSLVNSMVAIMAAPVVGADPVAVATSLRDRTNAANALHKKAAIDLRSVLRDDQVKKLPAAFTDAGPQPH